MVDRRALQHQSIQCAPRPRFLDFFLLSGILSRFCRSHRLPILTGAIGRSDLISPNTNTNNVHSRSLEYLPTRSLRDRGSPLISEASKLNYASPDSKTPVWIAQLLRIATKHWRLTATDVSRAMPLLCLLRMFHVSFKSHDDICFQDRLFMNCLLIECARSKYPDAQK